MMKSSKEKSEFRVNQSELNPKTDLPPTFDVHRSYFVENGMYERRRERAREKLCITSPWILSIQPAGVPVSSVTDEVTAVPFSSWMVSLLVT